jgi:hypothetical protein
MPDRTLFPHAFGLRTPVPLWSAPSLDRCLLLAFIYPIATIMFIWIVSGHVGQAESTLGLEINIPGWTRASAAALTSLPLLAMFSHRTKRWGRLSRWAVSIGILVLLLIATSVARLFISDGFFIVFYLGLGVILAISTSVGAIAVATLVCWVGLWIPLWLAHYVAPDYATHLITFVSLTSLIFVAVGLTALGRLAVKRRWQGPFLSILIAALLLICFGTAGSAPPRVKTMTLFLGFLTLVNAPFDWASLGLTRALLRRGLELRAWWPYGLALVDAGLAAVIIAALALTMVVGVQAFDALAVHRGGSTVLPLDALFNGIATQPAAPEYWWLYALLLSTMIPSLANLVIGGTSFVQGLPGVPSLLLRYIPERGGVLKWDRHWIATVLTAQVAAGAASGIAAQVFLVWVIIGHVMPFFGLELLDVARDVASFNIPARVGHLFEVSL